MVRHARGHTLLVGRRRELERLEQLGDDLRRGHCSIACIEGPAGIGKTHLVDSFMDRTAIPSKNILRMRGQQIEPPPYLPILTLLELLREATDSPEAAQKLAQASQLLGDSGIGVGETNAADSSSTAKTGSAEHARTAIFLDISAAISAAVRTEKMVIVLEDAQWLDEPSSALFEFVANELLTGPKVAGLLIIITTRSGRIDNESWHAGSLSSLPMFETIPLQPLSEGDQIELLLGLGVSEPSSAWLRDLTTASKGNPLYVREAVADMHASDGSSVGSGETLHRRTQSLRELVAKRIAALPTDTRQVLSCAAVLGLDFSTAEVAAAAGIGPADAEEHLLVGLDGDLLALNRDQIHFAHDLWQEMLGQRLLPEQRTRVHDRIATALIEAGSTDAGTPQRIGHHLVRGSRADHDAVIRHCETAGDLAFKGGAWSDAAELHSAALDSAMRDDREPSELNRLRLKAATTAERDMDVQRATELYSALAESAKTSGDVTLWGAGVDGEMRLSTAYSTSALSGELPAASLIEFLDAVDAHDSRVPVLTTWANLETTAGRLERGIDLSAQAVDAARRTGHRRQTSAALFAAGYAHLVALDPASAVALLRESEQLRSSPGDEWVQSESLSRRAWAHLLGGELTLAEDAASQALALAVKTRHWSDAALAETTIAAVALARGDLEFAVEQVELALRHASRSTYAAAPSLAFPLLVTIHRARGDLRACEQAIDRWNAAGLRGSRIHTTLLSEEWGIPDTSKEPRCPPSNSLGSLDRLGSIVELSSVRESSNQVETLQARFRELDGVVYTSAGQLVLRLQAMVAVLGGETVEAAELLREGIRVAEASGGLAEAAKCQLLLSAAVEDVDEAKTLAAQGRDLARRLGLNPSLYAGVVHDGGEYDSAALLRPQVTVVFADLVGSTHLSVHHGDGAYVWAVDRSREILRSRCAAGGGTEGGTSGDGFVAYFASASAAADFAISITADIAELDSGPGRPNVELKIGLATGNPIVREDSVYGATVNLAARLSDQARPGVIYADFETRQASQDKHAYSGAGTVELKGFPDSVSLFQLHVPLLTSLNRKA
jgi:class 3 adenylate cyclase